MSRTYILTAIGAILRGGGGLVLLSFVNVGVAAIC